MPKKFQYFDGKKFTRDEKTGYYLCSTNDHDGKRKRMHVYVWEYYNGQVPEGFHIHHINKDKSDNDILNLQLISSSEHASLHGKEYALNNHEKMVKNLRENAAPKAKEWHRSKQGHNWHKEHYEKTKDKLYAKKKYICEYCGKEFMSSQTNSRFCSNACKSAARRKSGIDNIVKSCMDCGGEYTANKYNKTKYCPLCRHKKHHRNRASGCLQYGS